MRVLLPRPWSSAVVTLTLGLRRGRVLFGKSFVSELMASGDEDLIIVCELLVQEESRASCSNDGGHADSLASSEDGTVNADKLSLN